MSAESSEGAMPRSPNPNGPGPEPGRGPRGSGLTRRAALTGVAALGAGAGVDRLLAGGTSAPAAGGTGAVPFHGLRQAGIATPPQAHLHFAAFDLAADVTARDLRGLLGRWTDAAEALTRGAAYDLGAHGGAHDPGEAAGLGAARLTLTFGFGPSLFDAHRLGISVLKPRPLAPLPRLEGEQLDPERSYGDLCVQSCADDPQVAFHAIHVLHLLAAPEATLRWGQLGFRRGPGPAAGAQSGRNLLGFKDGTNNIDTRDHGALARHVWVHRGDGPAWIAGGTYLVARRIQIVLSGWDPLTLAEQEQAIGRHKASGAPLGGHAEHDPVDLRAVDSRGRPVIPPTAHVRVAAPETNAGVRILRRGYSFSAGMTPGPIDAGGHQVDAGLFFIAYVRDPQRQFVPLQRHLASDDALTTFTVHTATAIFACPPGIAPGGIIGQGLFA